MHFSFMHMRYTATYVTVSAAALLAFTLPPEFVNPWNELSSSVGHLGHNMMMILLPEKSTNQYRKCNEAPLRIHSDAPSTASSSLGPPGWERSESAKKLPARMDDRRGMHGVRKTSPGCVEPVENDSEIKGKRITEGEIAGALTRAAIESCMPRLAGNPCHLLMT